MSLKIFFVLATLFCYDCLYSSFWAPLYNPRILNYRVDAIFDPDAGKNAREEYIKNYGVNGEKLIENFGNGRGARKDRSDNKGLSEIKFYYTYNDADKDEDTYSP